LTVFTVESAEKTEFTNERARSDEAAMVFFSFCPLRTLR
jgi:hypothetical protein